MVSIPMPPGGIYSVERWNDPVGRGVTGTQHVTLGGYAKVNTPKFPFCVANEFLASRIGVRLGITVPPGTLVQAQGTAEVGWVTLTFGDDLPPVRPAEIVTDIPSPAAGLIVFDTFILNNDRHTRNLAYRPSQKRMEVFDHSHSLFGSGTGDLETRLQSCRDRLVIDGTAIGGRRHCLLDRVDDPNEILGWAEKLVREVHEEFITESCRDVALNSLGPTDEQCDRMAEFLISRREQLVEVIRSEKSEFRSIHEEDWGLV